MKNIVFSLIFIIAVSCQNNSNLGEQFEVKNPISIDEAYRQLETKDKLDNVQIEGVVEKSCRTEGCWFTMNDSKGNEQLLNIESDNFKIPTNSPEKKIIALVTVTKDTTEHKTEQPYRILVKGLRFK